MRVLPLLILFLAFHSGRTQWIPGNPMPPSRPDWLRWTESVHFPEKADAIQVIQELIRILRSSQFPTAYADNISDKCKSDSLTYIGALGNFTLWALQMRESTGGFPEGLFGSLNTHSVGLFDECLAVRAPEFRGQYCTAYLYPAPVPEANLLPEPGHSWHDRGNWISWFQLIELYLNLTGSLVQVKPQVAVTSFFTIALPSVGVCIPSSCTADDFRQSIAQLVGGFALNNQSVVTATDELNCYVDTEQAPAFDGPDIAVLVTLCLLGLLVVMATLHESVRMFTNDPIDEKRDRWGVRCLHCFSALNNGRKLLSTERRSDDLSCIHGIRFLSTTWVMMGHCWIMTVYTYNYSSQLVVDDAYKWEFQAISNATNSVDTFFFLSGMLVAYFLLRELDRSKGRFNVLLFYVHRYLRLTPVYALVLGFVATLAVYLGTGPGWSMMLITANGCRSEWWKHLLYVNNLITPRDDSCMGHTWYMDNDMQLFLISPLLIYPLWKWRKPGLIWLAVVLLASLAGNFAVFAVFDLPPVGLITRPSDADPHYQEDYYIKPWVRAPPYLIGIACGWLLHVSRKSKISMRPAVVIAGWLLAIGTGLAIVYGLYPYIDEVQVPEIDPIVQMTYGPLNRAAWSIALAWVVLTCIHGHGGFINRLLSWKVFMPLGRLTYVAYLIHINYYSFFYAHARKPMYYTTFDEVHTYFGFLLMVFALSFVVCLTVEGPLLNLEKLLFSSRQGGPATKEPAVKSDDGGDLSPNSRTGENV